ncbi:ADP-ribosylation factor-like protein 16 [Anopheles maculipalpis]|uniref:ADP-ribosylation factor-like protein 16 n=1 Tax=Anopheles maculipalpis TaxID=1496333 RepID=UPI002159AECB|nr:ADP-ribosylation factor-like protein 16 [Anopheles maculipalpis]
MSYLCLGPMSAGKTLLLTCLQKPDTVNFTSHSVPSVGTNLYTIKIPPIVIDEKDVNQKIPPPGKRKELVQVREVGGCLAPIWRDYLVSPVEKLIYVVDTSNLCQISAAGVLLYSMLAEPRLQKTKFLLVLSKMDLAYRQMRNEALLMLQMEKFQKQIPQHITIVQFSAITKEGIDEVYDWLAMN